MRVLCVGRNAAARRVEAEEFSFARGSVQVWRETMRMRRRSCIDRRRFGEVLNKEDFKEEMPTQGDERRVLR